jgi:steroid 5-alpha reductase family enzyme
MVWVCIAYVICLFIGGISLYWLDYGPLINILLADLIATLVIFAFSKAFKNSSFYDAYWTVIPPFIALYWISTSEADVPIFREILVLGLILYWATRLTLNWAVHWEGMTHEDWRYQMLREKAPKVSFFTDLFGIHIFPTLQVFAGLLPVYALTHLATNELNWLDLVAALVMFGAVSVQMIADLQLHRFIAQKQPGDIIKTGLWSWSCHPNYFGELSFWFGLMLFGLAAYPAGWYWEIIGFVAMFCMFFFVSIPLMRERSLQRRPEYQHIIDHVSMLIPRPPKKGL